MQSSVVLDLRLIGFEAAQSSPCCCRLCNPVAAANSFKLALTDDLHRHSDLPIIGPLSGARHRGQVFRLSTPRSYSTVNCTDVKAETNFCNIFPMFQNFPVVTIINVNIVNYIKHSFLINLSFKKILLIKDD